jgi:hypothetical protein
METLLQARRRQRYHVAIKGNGQEEHVVVIAYSHEEMNSLINKLYKHIIIDEVFNQ